MRWVQNTFYLSAHLRLLPTWRSVNTPPAMLPYGITGILALRRL